CISDSISSLAILPKVCASRVVGEAYASLHERARLAPPISIEVAKLQSDKNETKHHGSRGPARLLQATCRVFDDPSVLALLTRAHLRYAPFSAIAELTDRTQ